MISLAVIRAFRDAAPYWVRRVRTVGPTLHAEVCRGLTTCGFVVMQDGALRLSGWADRPLPREVADALERLRGALTKTHGTPALPTMAGWAWQKRTPRTWARSGDDWPGRS